MSNNVNNELLDRAVEMLDISSWWAEELTNTTAGSILDVRRAQVLKHIEDKNLDDLYNYSLPLLEEVTRQVFKESYEREYTNA